VANEPDPYRTLGLSPGASVDDIRRAYRRLAKANHPDSAGEKALPRFLAIQAAYESLAGVPGTRRTGARASAARATPREREPWRPDPERARATREGRSAGADGATGRRRRPAGDEARRSGSGRSRPSNKATPGSTTYDAAEDEPFEPDWSGGTWYGASSGTYWTVNPKEYADPRKHGPEYQRRARRRLDGTAAIGPNEEEGDQPDTPPSSTDAGWTTVEADADAGAGNGGDPPIDPLAAVGLDADGALLGFRGGFPARIGLALVGWPPIGVAIATIAGEVTGCGRFAATCVEPFGVGTWLAQLAVIVVLLVVPSLAALSAVGTLAALAASIPTAVVLSASGGSREPAASATILGAVLALAYAAGVAFALVRRRQRGRVARGAA
jgi:Meckel syndrome type 1 protein